MNATQTRTGGVRNPLSRRIEGWLGGSAMPDCGRARTRAVLAVEGLEGRIVLSGAGTFGPTVIQNLASAIVQSSEHTVLQQPQKLPTVISSLESSQELTSLLNVVGVPTSDTFGSNIYLQQAAQYEDFTQVEVDVSLDLPTQPTSVPSADGISAFITSFDNAVTSNQTETNAFAAYSKEVSPSNAGSQLVSSIGKSLGLSNTAFTPAPGSAPSQVASAYTSPLTSLVNGNSTASQTSTQKVTQNVPGVEGLMPTTIQPAATNAQLATFYQTIGIPASYLSGTSAPASSTSSGSSGGQVNDLHTADLLLGKLGTKPF